MNVQESNQYLRERTKHLINENNKKREFVFFGAGSCAQRAIDSGYIPIAIIDNDTSKWGSYYNDKYKIISLNEFLSDYKKDMEILITSVYAPEIAIQLHEIGFYDFYSYLHSTREHYGSWNFEEEEMEKINQLMNLLSDDISRKLLEKIMGQSFFSWDCHHVMY